MYINIIISLKFNINNRFINSGFSYYFIIILLYSNEIFNSALIYYLVINFITIFNNHIFYSLIRKFNSQLFHVYFK